MLDPQMANGTLVELKALVKHFPIRGGVFLKEVASVRAVDGVNLSIREGETLGLVGESGASSCALRSRLRVKSFFKERTSSPITRSA
jgi:ABC-type glutathione transport system ATPase component